MANNAPARPLFRDQLGNPIGFYFHNSIKNASQRENLINYITNNGGEVLDTPHGADTVLVDEKHLNTSISVVQATYSSNRQKALHRITVEPMRFVQNCIRNNRFEHPLQQRQGMGGYIGRIRTEFTKKDDDNLCWYLSRRIPNPEDGGRLSTGVYKELCDAATFDMDISWGKRHTPASWLERYKKNRMRLDPIIEKYAKKYPSHSSALYGLSRRCNKNLKNAYKLVEPEDAIELTDDSAHEPEEFDEEVKSRRLTQASDGVVMSSKRRRIDSDVSSPVAITPAHHAARLPPSSPIRSCTGSHRRRGGKRSDVGQSTSGQHRSHDPFDFSPAPEHFEPRLPEASRSPIASALQGSQHLTPAPSPTLVQRQSSAVRSPRPPPPSLPPTRRVNLAMPRSPHPSTSFRNVAHSSLVFSASESPGRAGIRSHDTSATEPSSRSVFVPPELATNVPAESSITRESSHKRSSPITQPVKMSNRRFPARQSPIQMLSSEDDEQQQETQWAPFRNTRSRSKSTEPVPDLGMKRRKKMKGNHLPRIDQLLEPVHEGEIEYEQDLRAGQETATARLISTVMTETMQEEQSVADLLILNADVSVSRMPTGMLNTTADKARDEGNGEAATEGATQGARRFFEEDGGENKKGQETREENKAESKAEESEEATAQLEPAPTAVIKPDENRELELDASSDDEATRRQFLSNASAAARKTATRSQRQPYLESDHEDDQGSEIFSSPVTSHNTPLKTAKEVLAAFDDSPEAGTSTQRQHQQGRLFSSYGSGSPNPRNVRSHNAPEHSLSSRRLAQTIPVRVGVSLAPTRGLTGDTSVNQPQKLTGRHRVSSGGSGSIPSSVGSLPRTPLEASIRPAAGVRPSSSPRASGPGLQSQQVREKSRRESIESTSSELQETFPTPGTRAYAEKVKMEKELRDSPYSPPVGTKAAQVITARQRLRPPI